ncbi:glycosyltransferase family 29 protein [Ochrobactrum sp. CM-21-5]|nr:glycosyltransferase family 29 protein [Ochrobactrum sp. CM-21-5]MBC2884444.1 glycosyltransferase family 29 protein [Ochrobactrum sp. CM-21-5]
MKKTIFIVGNGPLPRDLSKEIDSADFVVRFNEPRNSIGMSGTKTDLLMLATSSKQMQQWLADPAFLRSAIFSNAPAVLFAFHPSIIRRFHPRPNLLSRIKGRRADWTLKAIEVLGMAGKEIRIMPPQLYFDVCEELGIGASDMKKVFPSTGFIGIWLALRDFPQTEWNVEICGFSWEGWKRHDWPAEKRWIERKINDGSINAIL